MNASASPSSELQLATLGGGCFWCTEAVFLDVAGVMASGIDTHNDEQERSAREVIAAPDRSGWGLTRRAH